MPQAIKGTIIHTLKLSRGFPTVSVISLIFCKLCSSLHLTAEYLRQDQGFVLVNHRGIDHHPARQVKACQYRRIKKAHTIVRQQFCHVSFKTLLVCERVRWIRGKCVTDPVFLNLKLHPTTVSVGIW